MGGVKMLSLRSKLLLGFGGLLLIILIIGIVAIYRVNDLGQSIDVILRENYRSVIAAQDMKESLERVDSAVLFVLLGYEQQGKAQINEYLSKFDKALRTEGGNITLPGEAEDFRTLQYSFTQYQSTLATVVDPSRPLDERSNLYFARLLPLFQSIKQSADGILQLNQQNMSDANMAARRKAAAASQGMYLLLICGGLIASIFTYYVGRWILHPVTLLTTSANEIARGNLDLVVGIKSNDEMGQLSRAFDAMASSLREYRRTNEARMLSVQRATQQALDNLSVVAVVVDLDGKVEVLTKPAREAFELKVGERLQECKHPWMNVLLQEVLKTGRPAQLGGGDYLIQVYAGGRERYFRPEAIPVVDELGQTAGVTLLLHDATQIKQQDELKKGLISTLSQQLDTSLRSIRTALFLMLDDRTGPLTPKQEELLVAARDDSEKLNAIVENLLDISRIQSGRIRMELRNVNAGTLALDSIAPYRVEAQEKGVSLVTSIPYELPEVQADISRIPHVFGNLLSNAIRHTPAGGRITISAQADEDVVWYSISDTGSGIPSEYLPRVFDQFFHVPEEEGEAAGAGLGLAAAKEIVTAHGGEMAVESQPGKGSTFSFSLRQAGTPAVLQETR
jgi:signal transduction histidine kinase/HAMP domain-containing protein